MKPHPKIRKTVKWGGAAVTVLLVVVWIASCFVHLSFLAPASSASKSMYGMSSGCVYLNIVSSATSFYDGRAKLAEGWHVDLRPRKPVWGFSYQEWPSAQYLNIPV